MIGEQGVSERERRIEFIMMKMISNNLRKNIED
jgi:hypothetical protein